MPEGRVGGILPRTMLPRPVARLLAGVLATLILIGVPSVTLATGTVTVPPEPGALVLPGPATLHAAVGDLDGDGRRELVRLVGGPETNGRVEAEAWRLGSDGWIRAGGSIVVRRGTSVEEAFTERATARTGSTPVAVGEPARILAWSDGTRERLLIAALGDQPFGIPCCLTLWEPVLEGGALALVARNEPNGPGETLHAIDLDGDGADELLMTQSEPPERAPGAVAPLQAEALAWDGRLFRTLDRETFEQGGASPIWLIGDTDRRPGEEAGFLQPGEGPSVLYRLRLEGGRLVLDTARVPPLISLVGVPHDSGRGIAYAAGGASFLASWIDDSLDVVADAPISGLLLPVIGGTSQPRLPIVTFDPLSLSLLDASLDAAAPTEPSAASVRAAALGVGGAWIGALPGGDRQGRPAIVFAGRLVGEQGTRDIASMVGAQPIGFLGDGEWVGVLHSLGAPYDLDREGGLLRPDALPRDPWLAIVPATSTLTPEIADGRLVPNLDGLAVASDPGDGAVEVLTTPDGFAATIVAPPGSRVVPVPAFPPLATMASGSIVPDAGSISLPIRSPTTDAAESRFAARALVLTPAGHAYTAQWDAQVLAGPPALSVTAETAPLSFDVTLAGRTVPGAVVTIDGSPAEVAADGTFSARVAAPPWPHAVRAEAVDPVGNRAVQLVSVVGLFDYRTLPWLAIIVLLTLAAGTWLFLRAPRRVGGAVGYDRVEAGALEEIDPDVKVGD